MRVLHLYSGNLYGGVERLLATLARERHRCPAMVPAFALCYDGRLARELRACGAEVALIGPTRASRPWTLWGARRRLAERLTGDRPDAVVCHGCWAHAIFAPVVRRRGLPLAFAAHDVPAGRHWLERWARRTVPDLVIANSAFTRSAAPKLFPTVGGAAGSTPCEVHYCPVPPPDREPGGSDRGAVRGELDTPAGAVVVLMSSRLERLKGHGVLLDALGRLKGLPEWVCWIAGGPQRPQEERYLAELRAAAERAGIVGRVRFLGQRGDVAGLLRAADLHCQPNVAPEGLGLAFIEALYAGVPVLTTAVGGGAEVVGGAAVPCGLLVPPGDVTALADALKELIVSPARRAALGRQGPGRAAELCDPAAAIPRLGRSLARICGIVVGDTAAEPPGQRACAVPLSGA